MGNIMKDPDSDDPFKQPPESIKSDQKETKREDKKEGKLDKDQDRAREPDDQYERGPPEYYQLPPYPPHSPYPGYYPPPRKQMFSSKDLTKELSTGLLIGIIILFAGAILRACANTTIVEYDYVKYLQIGSQIVGAAGLFIMGLFVVLPIMNVKDLSDTQKLPLFILLGAIIIGFALLI
jgi:hypothetical protein